MEALQAKQSAPPTGSPSDNSGDNPGDSGDNAKGGKPTAKPTAQSSAKSSVPNEPPKIGLAEELRRWESKALKAVKSGRGAAVRFASDAIPEEIAEEIRTALTAARTAEAVKAAFAEPAIRRVVLQRLEDLVQSELGQRAA
jgi:hypothetical protein